MSTRRVTSPLLPVSDTMRDLRALSLAITLAASVVCAACHETASASQARRAQPTRFDFGQAATKEEIKQWNIDVRPDGQGLPPDSGNAAEGAPIYAAQCAACHGADGVHGTVPPAPPLVGRFPGDSFPFATDTTAVATVGNYWPYATTLYDYINRSMPFPTPGSLTPHQVYALTAFILAKNDIIPAGAMMNAQTLPRVHMPSHNRFVPDDRTGGPHLR